MENNAILSALSARKSVRVFTPDPVTPDERAAILNAAFQAPPAGNQQLSTLLDITAPALPAPLADLCDTAVRQILGAAEDKGEHIAILEARKQYAWYLKGVPHANYYKEQIVRMNTLEDVARITEGIKRDLK